MTLVVRLNVGTSDTFPDRLAVLNRTLDELGPLGLGRISAELVGILEGDGELRFEPLEGSSVRGFVELAKYEAEKLPPSAPRRDFARLARSSPSHVAFIVFAGGGAALVHVARFNPLAIVSGGSA